MEEGRTIELTQRQKEIIEIITLTSPITSNEIAERIGVNRSTLRSDLQILSKLGFLTAKPKIGYVLLSPSSRLSEEYGAKHVGDVMSVAVAVEERESLYNVIIRIFLEDVGSIFVVGEKGLSGIVSRKDLLKAMIGGVNLNNVPVSMVMTRMPNIITVKENSTVSEAVQKLIAHEIDSMPVVREKEGTVEIVGRFTKTNATKLFFELINPRERQ